ncbi:MAG: agmatinase family protein [Candidatus Binataceae bacterium]
MAGLEGDSWKMPLDRSTDPKREPGPIELRRYVGTPAYAGIATFMGLPLCLNQEDLKAGKVDVAVIGAPVDVSAGHRGAQYGPRFLRADERILFHTPAMLYNPDTRIKPLEVLKVVDYGDAAVDPFSIVNSMEPIRQLVREVAEIGVFPMVLGGDHSILWPNGAAIADVYGPGNVGVVHLDAHPDCSNNTLGHAISHGTPIRRLIDDAHIPGRNFVQIGMRTALMDNELMQWMRDNGLRTHYMAEIDRIGFAKVLEKAIDEALDGPKHLYVSLDIDVLDPAFAPGTGTPEPPGLTNRELLPAIRRICHETPVVGMEVVEVAPHLDPTGYVTTMNARRAIFEALTGMAQRKLGITERNFLDPAAAGLDPPKR